MFSKLKLLNKFKILKVFSQRKLRRQNSVLRNFEIVVVVVVVVIVVVVVVVVV